MATALDSPIPPNRNPSFRLTEYYINDLTITDSLLVNQILCKFWKNIYSHQPGCQIPGLEIQFKIETIDIVQNKKLQDNYEDLKNQAIETREIIVFHGFETKIEAEKAAKSNIKASQIEMQSGFVVYTNPMFAMTRQGLYLMACKVLIENGNYYFDDDTQNRPIILKMKDQILPIGILNLKLDVLPKANSQESKYTNTLSLVRIFFSKNSNKLIIMSLT